jgi:hypothetical protein
VSVRLDAIEEMASRLSGILKTSGYHTDAGQKLFLGETPNLSPDDPAEALALVVREDSVGYQGENVVTELPVEVQALVVKGTDGSLIALERVIADIKKAVEIDHDLGGVLIRRGLVRGATRPHEREAGGTSVGASVDYVLHFGEKWGGDA